MKRPSFHYNICERDKFLNYFLDVQIVIFQSNHLHCIY